MAIKLEKVIPIGRRMVEYEGMFGLRENELDAMKIVDCGGGPSSFNSEATRAGANVVSIDPIYQFTPEQIQGRVDESFDPMFDQVRKNEAMFTWDHIHSVDELIDYRRTAIEMFVSDFGNGKDQERYQFQELPNTNFEHQTFDLALSSHFLFLYSEHLSFTFHLSSIREMLRIAEEVRIFPLVDLKGNVSPHLEEIIAILRDEGFEVDIMDVDYEFLKGANQYLKIR